MTKKIITLEVDELDYKSIYEAILIRNVKFKDVHGNVVMPDIDTSNGAVVAEICRGWMDFMFFACDKNPEGGDK